MKNPRYGLSIYKHGRLKTIKEMEDDETIVPVPKETVDKCRELTEDVEVDLQKPLDEESLL